MYVGRGEGTCVHGERGVYVLYSVSQGGVTPTDPLVTVVTTGKNFDQRCDS